MADQHTFEGSSTSSVSAESSESIVELNIKTLDSQMYSFHVDKNMPVLMFKEKIAGEIGVPVGQQRLIFRGKVLKDDHVLSEYHVENGHTLHLVARQPSQPQPSSGTSIGETTANSEPEASAGGTRTRVGQVSHSVVLGTFNQGEGVVPDLNRVIGAVLNSLGIVNQTATNGTGGIQPNMQFNVPAQTPQRNETESTQGIVGDPSLTVNQLPTGQAFVSQSIPQVLQIPLGAAIPLPSLNVPIPDSLNTLSEFMNRMELALSQNGYQPNQSLNNTGDLPTVELPANARGLPTPEALAVVLRHAQHLLGGRAIAALSHIAGRLEQEGGSTDPTVRSQIQTESMQVGLAMQHIGALLLELSRTMLTLRMGQSPVESFVNAGPAVYISPSGPNPIMVQPFPLQTSSLFGGTAAPPLNPGAFGAGGVGTVPRHINIHIHTAVGPRATNGERLQGDRANGTGSGDSGQTRVPPVPRPTVVSVSSAVQPGVTVSQPSPDSASLSTVIAEVNSRIRSFIGNMRSENQTSLGQSEGSTFHDQSVGPGACDDEMSNNLRNQTGNGAGETSLSLPGGASETESQMTQDCHQSRNEEDVGSSNLKDVPSSSSDGDADINCSNGETTLKSLDDVECALRSVPGTDNPEGATSVPLGLGLGGLQPKRRSGLPRSQGKSGDGVTSNVNNQNQHARSDGQQVLQSLASLANRRNANNLPSGQLQPPVGGVIESIPSGGHVAGGQFDPANVMTQVLQSPALNGLLAGVSQQTGVGSPDVLRNMLGQLTQNPVMMNTVNQIAQQIDSQDLGNMFSGLGSVQGGGIDLSRMFQQMMPIVSQVLGSVSTVPQEVPAAQGELQPLYNEPRPSRDEKPNDQNSQINLQQVAQRIEHQDPPGEVFRSVIESAVRLHDNGSGTAEGLVDELCTEEGLASEFMEMLRRDISQRLRDETGSAEKS